MLALTTKYRPSRLTELRGQPRVLHALRSYLAAPYSTACLFHGETGLGKSSGAYALACELGVLPDQHWGGWHELAAGELTKENVKERFACLNYGASNPTGWRFLLIDEADAMSSAAELALLGLIDTDKLPDRCTVVFTTNKPDKLSDRFKDRCLLQCEFTPAPQAAAELVAHVWRSETGGDRAPTLKDLACDGNSFRKVLAALTPFCNRARQLACA